MTAKKTPLMIWLISLSVLLLLMIAIGGTTRLTRSGLSITEWRPITGILPPLSQSAWQQEFDLYKASPEYKHYNQHFEVEDYKKIYWWEYVHRVFGRLIFLWALIPAMVFLKRGAISKNLAFGLPALIVLQGLMGWLMVKSGLNERPSVSHYMLSLHFFLALITLIVVYKPLAQMKSMVHKSISKTSQRLLLLLGLLIGMQILLGCFTSGLKAGLIYNTFPLMEGKLIAASATSLSPFWLNFFENPSMIQWLHRWLGISCFAYMLFLFYYFSTKYPKAKFHLPFLHLVSVTILQIFLGVFTLLLEVPIHLAVAHQFMACLVALGFYNIWFRVQTERAH